jgi:serine/threonine-protein kinase
MSNERCRTHATHLWWLALPATLTLGALGGCDEVFDDTGETDPEIRGGDPSNDLRVGNIFTPAHNTYGSASIIGDGRMVLTAKHVQGAADEEQFFRFNYDGDSFASEYRIIGWATHPDVDLAIALLEAPVTGGIPSQLNDRDLAPGQSMEIVGYGGTEDLDYASPQQHRGTVSLTRYQDNNGYPRGFLYADTPPNTTTACPGDSGGPAFVNGIGGPGGPGATIAGVYTNYHYNQNPDDKRCPYIVDALWQTVSEFKPWIEQAMVSLADGTPQQMGSTFGAIAYSSSTGAVGSSWNYGDAVGADNSARGYCGQPDCAVLSSLHDTCGALAVGNGYWYWNDHLSSKADAEIEALKGCSDNTSGCAIKTSVCSNGAAYVAVQQPSTDSPSTDSPTDSPPTTSAKFAAIAYSFSTTGVGSSWNYDDQSSAEASAMSFCGGGDCQIIVSVRDSCGALAVGYTYTSWSYNIATKADAEQAALASCSASSSGCTIRASVCGGG